MIKVVLFDLDATLVRVQTDAFVREYIRLLADTLAQQLQVPAERCAQAIRTAIRAVIADLDPTCSNRAVFERTFAETLAMPLDVLRDAFERAQTAIFPTLEPFFAPEPVAMPLLRSLLEREIAFAVVTNPVFSLETIRQRMIWGNLPLDLPYALITNLDELHFAKPQPHLYEEVLARIGYEPDQAIMVGDDFQNDIAPSQAIGMHAYWINGAQTLATFAAEVQNGLLERLARQPLESKRRDQVMPRLLGNTAALFGMVASAPPQVWHMRPDPEEWTPLEIVHHLRESERDVQRPRLRRIAEEDNPFLPAPPQPFRPNSVQLTETAQEIAADFWRERAQTLAFLEQLPSETWSRPARHAIFGPTTLLEMAHFTARHDRLHLTQLCQTISKCQAD
ncbi:MAG: HAD hydrolase-like protein [Anaerolineae bacterium]|nr:HAD hydrolase-like protein [Anaerolineae bacterium]